MLYLYAQRHTPKIVLMLTLFRCCLACKWLYFYLANLALSACITVISFMYNILLYFHTLFVVLSFSVPWLYSNYFLHFTKDCTNAASKRGCEVN